MPAPTPQQSRAIDAEGDVLVMAGAGAGKTSTLVGRILDRALDASRGHPLDRFLVVTFTEAAAAEMRHRLGIQLEERRRAAPHDDWIEQQIALLDSSHVSTLHAFCLRLIREHFHELGLDPQFAVQDAIQTQAQRRQVLDELLNAHYSGTAPEAAVVRRFLERHAGEGDAQLRDLVLRIHDYSRSLPDPEAWRRRQREVHTTADPQRWRVAVAPGVRSWIESWREFVAEQVSVEPLNFAAVESLAAIVRHQDDGDVVRLLDALIEAGADERFQKGGPGFRKKGIWHEPLERLFDDAAELRAYLVPTASGGDPLIQDWTFACEDVLAVLELVEQFDSAFLAARRANAALDFSDLEQLALRLLWDSATDRPTALALEWRNRFVHVLVDEYQDISPAQDRIVASLSREGDAPNRFLVGDVKQSIYRFRRADPGVFQHYAREWQRGGPRSVLPLAENFRSHEAILAFVNEVFDGLMRREVGGVGYDADARLVFGAPESRSAMREQPGGRVELHLVVTGTADASPDGEEESPEGGADQRELDVEERQAAIIAARLRTLFESGASVCEAGGSRRPMRWRDVAVLHPAPAPVAERWAREFAHAGIPFEAKRGGFFDAIEVADLVNLARLLDNPIQDHPALAVLRSPLAGLTLDELVAVRLFDPRTSFWDAAEALAAKAGSATLIPDPTLRAATASARSRLQWFLERFQKWRRLAREASLARCIETVLADTSYEAWLRAQPRAEARLANLRKLLDFIRQFDLFQRAGLFRFLQFVDSQSADDQQMDAAPAADGDSVRLMSIHQSKGLEFPFVVVAGLGRKFNLRDTHAEWLIDDELGICPPVLAPNLMRAYPSVARWFASKRSRTEAIGEQIRLLYVALTRAVERLLLVGTATGSRLDAWREARSPATPRELIDASQPLAWLGPRMSHLTGDPAWMDHDTGSGRWIDWTLYRGELPGPPAAPVTEAGQQPGREAAAIIRKRLNWQYPWLAATQEPAKAAVTTLRRRWSIDEEAATRDEDARELRRHPDSSAPVSGDAVERGLAHHLFFEMGTLSKVGSRDGVEAERDRLLLEGWLSAEQSALLDLDGIAAFWTTPLGIEIQAKSGSVQREVPFTIRLSREEATRLGSPGGLAGFGPDDFLVVQGVADLVVIQAAEIWLVDFKTDRVPAAEVDERASEYRAQLALYAHALTAIYQRPVTRRCLWFVAARRLVEMRAS